MISHACPVDQGVPVRGLSYFHAWTVWTIDFKEENILLFYKIMVHTVHASKYDGPRTCKVWSTAVHGGPRCRRQAGQHAAKENMLPGAKQAGLLHRA